MLIHQGWFTALYTLHLLDSQSFEFEICILQALNMLLIRCTNVVSKGGYPVTLLPPPRRLRSGSCHHPTAATKCTEQPRQATANPVHGKACSSTNGGLLRYIHLLDSQSFEFEICILQALIMPLIRCINVVSKGGYPVTGVTLLSPPRRLIPSLGLGTTQVRQLPSGSCHHPTAATKGTEQPRQATANTRRWKSMLIHQGWFTALYTLHLLDSQSFQFEICTLQALNMPLIRCPNVVSKGGYPLTLFTHTMETIVCIIEKKINIFMDNEKIC